MIWAVSFLFQALPPLTFAVLHCIICDDMFGLMMTA